MSSFHHSKFSPDVTDDSVNYETLPVPYPTLFGITDCSIASQMIKSRADVNVRDNNCYTPLFYVKSVDMAQLLLDNGAQVNFPCGQNSPLFTSYNYDIVLLLLKYNANPLHIGKNNNTMLFHCHNEDMMRTILDTKVDPNHINNDNMTALYFTHNYNMVQLLLDYNCNPNSHSRYNNNNNNNNKRPTTSPGNDDSMNDNGISVVSNSIHTVLSPLYYVKDAKSIRLLFKYGAQWSNHCMVSPLLCSLSPDMAQAYLDNGVTLLPSSSSSSSSSPSSQKSQSPSFTLVHTSLYESCTVDMINTILSSPHLTTIEKQVYLNESLSYATSLDIWHHLINAKADPTDAIQHKYSFKGLYSHDITLVQHLLDLNIDPNIKPHNTSITPLLYTENSDITQLLIQYNANIIAPALHYAQNIDKIKVLLHHNANCKELYNKKTALCYARTSDIAKLLILSKISVETQPSPLHTARNGDIINTIISYKGNPNIIDNRTGSNPLHTARTSCVVSSLLNAQCDPYHTNKDRLVPFYTSSTAQVAYAILNHHTHRNNNTVTFNQQWDPVDDFRWQEDMDILRYMISIIPYKNLLSIDRDQSTILHHTHKDNVVYTILSMVYPQQTYINNSRHKYKAIYANNDDYNDYNNSIYNQESITAVVPSHIPQSYLQLQQQQLQQQGNNDNDLLEKQVYGDTPLTTVCSSQQMLMMISYGANMYHINDEQKTCLHTLSTYIDHNIYKHNDLEMLFMILCPLNISSSPNKCWMINSNPFEHYMYNISVDDTSLYISTIYNYIQYGTNVDHYINKIIYNIDNVDDHCNIDINNSHNINIIKNEYNNRTITSLLDDTYGSIMLYRQ